MVKVLILMLIIHLIASIILFKNSEDSTKALFSSLWFLLVVGLIGLWSGMNPNDTSEGGKAVLGLFIAPIVFIILIINLFITCGTVLRLLIVIFGFLAPTMIGTTIIIKNKDSFFPPSVEFKYVQENPDLSSDILSYLGYTNDSCGILKMTYKDYDLKNIYVHDGYTKPSFVSYDIFYNGQIVIGNFPNKKDVLYISDNINIFYSKYEATIIKNSSFPEAIESFYSNTENDNTSDSFFYVLNRKNGKQICIKSDKEFYKEQFNTEHSIIGERPKTNVFRTIKNNSKFLKYDYEYRLREKTDLKGALTAKFLINESGYVINCDIIKSTINDLKFENAIKKKIVRWKFGKIDKKGDVTEVIYSFKFPQ